MKKQNIFIGGKKIYLRPVEISDITGEYQGWVNDRKITQFTETKYFPHNYETIKDFVERANKDRNTLFLAIAEKKTGRHIGNIKFGPINWIHRVGDISLIVGAKDGWAKGYAREAIDLVTGYAFKTLNMHKVIVGIYEGDKTCLKIFEGLGYVRESIRRKEFFRDGKYRDIYWFGILDSEYKG